MQSCFICGIDEAGRGPLAGPVVAGAVLFKPSMTISEKECLNDSKKLSEKKRLVAYEKIKLHSFYGIGWATHQEIDELNILQASFLAMQRAFSILFEQVIKENPEIAQHIKIIVDGNMRPSFAECAECKAVVKADASIQEVMAASILAKVVRDEAMKEYAKIYPQWGYEKHKGYPTKAHKEALKLYGISPIQRKSFKF